MSLNENKRCKQCGAILDEKAQFCEDCGHPVAEPKISQSQPSPFQGVPQPPTRSHNASIPSLPQPNIPPVPAPVSAPPPISFDTARPHPASSAPPAPKKRGITCLTVGLVLLFGGLCLIVLAVGAYFIYSRFDSPTPITTPPATEQSPTSMPIATPTLPIPSGTVEEFFKVWSIREAYNTATAPTTFTINDAWQVTEILTYHWNNGQGMSSPGTIGLKAADGTMYGPWSAAGQDGQGGVPNAAWVVHPNVIIPPGAYTVIDSDPDTWSQNAETGGAGMAWGYGVRQDNP